ncbi:MAG: hypothetical protein JWN08_2949 [Frankiales bacterium]|nr:hypothetical protein [Frankiales bacterium]
MRRRCHGCCHDGPVTRFGDALASGADLRAVAEQAAEQAIAGLDAAPDLVCVFVCADDPDDVVAAGEQVARTTGARVLLGCSAGGVLGAGRGIEGAGAVSVLAAVLPGVRLRPFHLEVMRSDAGAAVVGLPERDGDEVALLLADPYSFPADGFVSQTNSALPGLAVVGGLAHGPRGAGSTRLLLDGRAVGRGAVGVLLQGAGARTLVSQGCRPVGPAMTVTGARGNVVLELAGSPALQRIEDLLADLPPAEQALASSGLSLGIAMDEYAEDHDFLVRAILGAERETGGLVVGDLVEVGQTVRLQVRDADAADADLRAHLAAYDRDGGQAGGALLFSCNGRGAHLFGTAHGGADHDAVLVRDGLRGPAVAGFFAGGELGPVAGRNHLHGFTASLLAFPR